MPGVSPDREHCAAMMCTGVPSGRQRSHDAAGKALTLELPDGSSTGKVVAERLSSPPITGHRSAALLLVRPAG